MHKSPVYEFYEADDETLAASNNKKRGKASEYKKETKEGKKV